MLTETLRSLERDGFLTRKVNASVPPKVEYTLTPLGASLATTHAPAPASDDRDLGCLPKTIGSVVTRGTEADPHHILRALRLFGPRRERG